MSENAFGLENITIEYGRTTVGELLRAGYTISDFTQIIEEPTLASCNLNKDGRIVGLLCFYELKSRITIEQLSAVPVDLFLPEKDRKREKTAPQKGGRFTRSRIFWTVLIHLISAAGFALIYAVPALLEWVGKEGTRRAGISPAMILLVLPAILITFLWGGTEIKNRPVLTKTLLALWLILNVAISVAYLVAIDNAFAHRFW